MMVPATIRGPAFLPPTEKSLEEWTFLPDLTLIPTMRASVITNPAKWVALRFIVLSDPFARV